ncbi:MAG TPA: hypothetical protein VMI54_08535, partial [Polyangiaceae bacterium]|nr:hypothetical protein [Polyangiaceae bacterium]
ALLSAAVAFAVPAAAQAPDEATRTAARALGNAGVEAYQANDFATATDKLEKAYALLRAPSLGLWSGRALVKVGKWVEAADRFLEAASLQVPAGDYSVQKRAQADAALELAALKPKIPSLAVAVSGAELADCSISIDGQPVASSLVSEGRLVNPGTHVIDARHGTETAHAEVTLAEAEHKTAKLEFAAPAPPPVAPVLALPPVTPPPAPAPVPVAAAQAPSSSQRTWGWVAIGAGGVGVVVGGITGLAAVGKKSDLDGNPNCRNGRCAPSEQSSINGYNTLRGVSSVGFYAGGALAALGVVLLVTAPSRATAQAYVGPGTAGLRGSF